MNRGESAGSKMCKDLSRDKKIRKNIPKTVKTPRLFIFKWTFVLLHLNPSCQLKLSPCKSKTFLMLRNCVSRWKSTENIVPQRRAEWPYGREGREESLPDSLPCTLKIFEKLIYLSVFRVFWRDNRICVSVCLHVDFFLSAKILISKLDLDNNEILKKKCFPALKYKLATKT